MRLSYELAGGLIAPGLLLRNASGQRAYLRLERRGLRGGKPRVRRVLRNCARLLNIKDAFERWSRECAIDLLGKLRTMRPHLARAESGEALRAVPLDRPVINPSIGRCQV